MNLFMFRIIILLTFINLFSITSEGSSLFETENEKARDTTTFVSRFDADNNRCFKCHGQEKYEYTNETIGKHVKDIMCSERIVRRKEFYSSNHRSFSCTDCHSEEYVKFPHSGELRMEQKYICIDCHGGDAKFAKYHFEEIDSEYRKSTHFKMENEGFSCWKCHNPHTYKITVRNSTNLKETIAYDNAICLNCHSDYNNFQLLSDKAEIDIIKKHECLPKNSILMASLYKFESKKQRRDGFFNGIILNASYVIGANRNEYLNFISLIIFFIVIIVIVVHIVFRVKKKTKNIKEE